ncbi:MAG: hypothetical protein AAF414_24055 [Pseudomonadota bacterium]
MTRDPVSSESPVQESIQPAGLGVRLCRDCGHHRPPGGRLRCTACLAPSVAIDLVTGAPAYGVPCAKARGHAGRCGLEDRWWDGQS